MANADFRNIDAVLSQYDAMATPLYEVFEGKQKKFDSLDHCEDIEDAKNFLSQQLEAIKYFGNTAMFKIVFFRELGTGNKLSLDNLKGSNTFKLLEYDEAGDLPYWKRSIGGHGSLREREEMTELKAMIAAQQSQINALMEDPDDTEGMGSVQGGLMGSLSGLLQNPDVQKALAEKIVGFINTVLPSKSLFMQPVTQLGSVTENDVMSIQNSLSKLFAAGMTCEDFKKLAEISEDSNKFNLYLSMLRGS